jgi:hypothetical protein
VNSRPFRFLAAATSLVLWLFTLVVPWVAFQNDLGQCLHEFEHSESESEGEEWVAEWDESCLPAGVWQVASQDKWHEAHVHNVEVLEQLNAQPLLDPPEA